MTAARDEVHREKGRNIGHRDPMKGSVQGSHPEHVGGGGGGSWRIETG